MDVNKAVLEKMSSKELEAYIKPESRFVPEAVEYAFEILKEREYEFSEADLERWNALKQKKVQSLEEKEVHPDYKKAANLWYISVALGFINLVLNPTGIFFGIVVLLMLSGIGYLISKGHDWIRYALLAMTILGTLMMLLTFRTLLILYLSNPIMGIVSILQNVLQIWVLIILFRIPKKI